MPSHRELSKLTTNMNTILSVAGLQETAKVLAVCLSILWDILLYNQTSKGTPVSTPLPGSMLTRNGPDQDSISTDTPPSQRQVESFTPCVRQNDRSVDPSGKLLQPGTIIICDKIPFIVSNNGKNLQFHGR